MDVETEKGENYEAEHVHAVYEEIASHFSSTRYKPWPIVERFLSDLPDGSVGLDIGCGNGKYLGVNRKVFIIGSDRSTNLAHIAAQPHNHPHATIVADTLALPHAAQRFDFAISIAVIHHLSTSARRVQAVRTILEVLRRPERNSSGGGDGDADGGGDADASGGGDGGGRGGGRALVYVWALEQRGSRRGWDVGDPQDVMVPWVLKGKKQGSAAASASTKKGGKSAAADQGVRSGLGGGQGEDGDGEVGSGGEAATEMKETPQEDKVFQRYYHLYREGELESDVEEAGGVVLESGYEKDNWWAIIAPI